MQSDISLEEDVNDLNQKVRQVFLTFGVIHLVCIQPWRREALTYAKKIVLYMESMMLLLTRQPLFTLYEFYCFLFVSFITKFQYNCLIQE